MAPSKKHWRPRSIHRLVFVRRQSHNIFFGGTGCKTSLLFLLPFYLSSSSSSQTNPTLPKPSPPNQSTAYKSNALPPTFYNRGMVGWQQRSVPAWFGFGKNKRPLVSVTPFSFIGEREEYLFNSIHPQFWARINNGGGRCGESP